MLQRTIALVQRSLRVDSRDIRPHLFRMALPGIFIVTLIMMQMDNGLRSAPGRSLLGWLVTYDYLFITFAAATFFATAISEEREQQTLGLLQMAGVGPLALLLGKWFPRLWSGILLLLVQLPFTLLCVTLGGVMWNQVMALFACLLAHLLLVSSIALVCSVWSRTSSAACGWATFTIVAMHLGVWIGSSLLNAPTPPVPTAWLDHFLGANRLFRIMEIAFDEPILSYQVWSNLGVSLMLSGIAWGTFALVQEKQEFAASPAARKVDGSPRVSRRAWQWSPLIWQGFYQVVGGPMYLVGRMIVHFLTVMALLMWMSSWGGTIDSEEFAGVLIFWGVFAWVCEGAYVASQVFRGEIAGQTWSTLCLLPRSLPEIAYPRLLGALTALVPAIGCIGFGLWLVLDDFVDVLDEDEFWMILFYFSAQVVLGWHLTTLFSITIDWSAWPISIFLATVVVVLANICLMVCIETAATGSGEQALVWLVGMATYGASGVVHVLIGSRLTSRLGE
ncbi:MAG: ABC transporter permease subunit [Planctomycetaceae bacterium]|nr:ABC transporter permease subunit [Planctomycetaceae bacterium]